MRQHVHLTRLQGGETVLGRQGRELDFLRIVENRGGDGAAIIDIETMPDAMVVGQAETGKAGMTPQASAPR